MDAIEWKVSNKKNTNKLDVFPKHPMVKHWLFSEETEAEAMLAHHVAVVAEKGGISVNQLQHLFPAILRMLKNKSDWAK